MAKVSEKALGKRKEAPVSQQSRGKGTDGEGMEIDGEERVATGVQNGSGGSGDESQGSKNTGGRRLRLRVTQVSEKTPRKRREAPASQRSYRKRPRLGKKEVQPQPLPPSSYVEPIDVDKLFVSEPSILL